MNCLPEILSLTCETDSALLRLRVSPELEYFSGHFPGQPILPGVVQVNWAIQLGGEYFALPLKHFSGLKALKFTAPVTPGMVVELQLDWLAAKQQLNFCYSQGKRRFATGQVQFSTQS